MGFSRSPPTLFYLIVNYNMFLFEVVISHITDILELFKIEGGAHNEILTLTSVTRTSIDLQAGFHPLDLLLNSFKERKQKFLPFYDYAVIVEFQWKSPIIALESSNLVLRTGGRVIDLAWQILCCFLP